MLRPLPQDNNQRYTRLREYFSDLHCPSTWMEEQNIRKHTGKNLICVLPGKDTDQIVVAARYEHRDRMDGAPGWNEAVMLPILYNALQAQPRQHTFVFAALYGRAGEKAFLDSLRNKNRPSPKAIIVLDMLGFSSPLFYVPPVPRLSANWRERAAMNKRLESEALLTSRIEKISTITGDPPQIASQNTLIFEADKIPSLLFYSFFDKNAPAQAFHQSFEYLAYYLCRIDIRLADETPSSSPAAKPAVSNP